MNNTDIPNDVLDFIVRRIDSVPHLETLLLFWESPDAPWTDGSVAARVYVSRDKAREILQDLARHGFIAKTAQRPDGYVYQPAWDEAQLVPKIAAAYRQHLVHVASIIHAKASYGSVQEFARAFQFKQKG
jgi:hypothetical protein